MHATYYDDQAKTNKQNTIASHKYSLFTRAGRLRELFFRAHDKFKVR